MAHHFKHFVVVIFFFTLATAWLGNSAARAASPVVRAVLFYSPTCPHCHQVIEEVLLPLLDQYGEQLDLVGIDITTTGGTVLYDSAIKQFRVPAEQQGVPMLVVGETVLIGSRDIPAQFPGLIEQNLAADGTDWPPIPGLLRVLETAEPQPTQPDNSTQTPGMTVPETPTSLPAISIFTDKSGPGIGDRLAQDPAGNVLAVLILVGMLVSVIYTIGFLQPAADIAKQRTPSTWVPILCLIGIAVAGYLAYIETTHAQAVCGPVGDCNTLQQREYARLFVVIPVGILGLIGYFVIILVWLSSRHSKVRIARLAAAALLGITFFGTLFSIYLTYLEPFVIGSSCAWCLGSAIIMTALLWLSTVPGKQSLAWLGKNGILAGR